MSSENALMLVGPEDVEKASVSSKPVRREAAPLSPVMGNRGLELRTLDEMIRFAKIAHESNLAPKGIDTPQKVLIALEMGAELGLKPMMALQNIGVINGRPAPFGKASLTLCRQSGILEEFEEWYELQSGGESLSSLTEFPDTAAAVCYSRRRGQKTGLTTRFSVADAKRAKLWGKEGPWSTYPARMLKFRARGFNLTDNFPDVMMGFTTYEEVRDYPNDPEEDTPHRPAKAESFFPSETKAEGGAPSPNAPADGGGPPAPSPEEERLLGEEKSRFTVLAKQAGFTSKEEITAFFESKQLRSTSALDYYQKANGLLEERVREQREREAEPADFQSDDPFADPPGDDATSDPEAEMTREELLREIDELEVGIESDPKHRATMSRGWRKQAGVPSNLNECGPEQLRAYHAWLADY